MGLILLEDLGNIKRHPEEKRKRRYVKVKCSYCDEEIIIRKSSLEKSKSCGCANNKLRSDQKVQEIIGTKFGKLTIKEDLGLCKFNSGYTERKVLVDCECGNTDIVKGLAAIKKGETLSCGCLQRMRASETLSEIAKNNVKHGMEGTRLYKIWDGMKDRCYREKNKMYHRYGGRGITVCDEWLGNEGFENFMKWAFQNGYDDTNWKEVCKKDRLSIDRIDNDKGYYPTNCQWITLSKNSSKGGR